MRSIIIFLEILFLTHFAISQNPTYQLYWDSIYPEIQTDYASAKDKFVALSNVDKVDPSATLHFLTFSLEKSDSIFKENMIELMKSYGFKYNRTDTLGYVQHEFNDLAHKLGYSHWLIKTSDSLFPIWLASHPKEYELRVRIERLRILDQTRGRYYALQDSCNISQRTLRSMDFELFAQLIMICKENENRVPNYFDIGFEHEWSLILLHNLAYDNAFDNWLLILPYIEKAYFEGKIGDGVFRLLDQMMERKTGFQYYGFIENAPIKDEEGLTKRREKYGFE